MEPFPREILQLRSLPSHWWRGCALWTFCTALALTAGGCLNPFAPGLDTSAAQASCDPMTIDGAFRCFQSAYDYRDTTVYGRLLDNDFTFIYRDYDLGVDVTWGREDEMRSTYGLFQNAQTVTLIWNSTASTATDSTYITVVRGFSLTIVFNPSDIETVTGYADITFYRQNSTNPWKIVRWRDESAY